MELVNDLWACAGCGRPVCRGLGVASLRYTAEPPTVSYQVEGVCADHQEVVRRLLADGVEHAGPALRRGPRLVQPRTLLRWQREAAQELLAALGTAPRPGGAPTRLVGLPGRS